MRPPVRKTFVYVGIETAAQGFAVSPFKRGKDIEMGTVAFRFKEEDAFRIVQHEEDALAAGRRELGIYNARFSACGCEPRICLAWMGFDGENQCWLFERPPFAAGYACAVYYAFVKEGSVLQYRNVEGLIDYMGASVANIVSVVTKKWLGKQVELHETPSGNAEEIEYYLRVLEGKEPPPAQG